MNKLSNYMRSELSKVTVQKELCSSDIKYIKKHMKHSQTQFYEEQFKNCFCVNGSNPNKKSS